MKMADATQKPLTKIQRPTQKTIARLTGLAVPTVSRALADAPDIGSATKKLVRDVAAEIGYRPDRAGVRLRTGKTNVISLVLTTDHDMMNYTAQLISAIAGELRNSPYHMIITPYFTTEDPMDPVRYIVETQSADAVILHQTKPDDPRVKYLMEHDFPFVTHGRTNWSDDHPYFDFDNEEFAALAVQELHARGRRHILLVLPPMDQNYAMLSLRGAIRKSRSIGVKTTELTSANSDQTWAVVQKAVSQQLQANPTIDGIVCCSVNAAMATALAAEEADKVLGEDLDIAAKEAFPMLKQFRAPILTQREDVARAGRFLARAAVQRIADPSAPPLQELEVPTRFG